MAQVRKYQSGGAAQTQTQTQTQQEEPQKSWFIKNGVKQEFNQELYNQLYNNAEAIADPEAKAKAKEVLDKGLKAGSTIYYDGNNIPYVVEADGTRTDFYKNTDKISHRSKAREFFDGLVNSQNNRAAMAADQVFNGRITTPQADVAAAPEKTKIDIGAQLYLPIVGEGENAYYNTEGIEYLKGLERLKALKQSLTEEGWNDKNEFTGNDDITYYLKNKQNVAEEIDELINLFNDPEALKALTSTSKEALRLKALGIGLGNAPTKKGGATESLGDAAAKRADADAKVAAEEAAQKAASKPAVTTTAPAEAEEVRPPVTTFTTRGNYYSPGMREAGLELSDEDLDRKVGGYQYATLNDGRLVYRTQGEDGKYLYAIKDANGWQKPEGATAAFNAMDDSMFKDAKWQDDELIDINNPDNIYTINGKTYLKGKAHATKASGFQGVNKPYSFTTVFNPDDENDKFIVDETSGKAVRPVMGTVNGLAPLNLSGALKTLKPKIAEELARENPDLTALLSSLTPEEYTEVLNRVFNHKATRRAKTQKAKNGGVLKAQNGVQLKPVMVTAEGKRLNPITGNALVANPAGLAPRTFGTRYVGDKIEALDPSVFSNTPQGLAPKTFTSATSNPIFTNPVAAEPSNAAESTPGSSTNGGNRVGFSDLYKRLATNLKTLTSPERQLQWMDRMQAWKNAIASGNVQRNGIREANEIGKMAGMPAQTQVGPFNATGYHAQNNAINAQLADTANQFDTITDNSLRVNALLGASNAAIQAKGQNNLNLDNAYSQYASQVDAAKNQDNQMRYNVARGYADGNKQAHLGMMDATLKEINNKSTILDTALREDIQGFRGDKALRANAVFSPQDNYELQQLLLAERKGDFKITKDTSPEQIAQIQDKLARLNDLKERSNKAYIMQLSMPTYTNTA